MVTEPLVSIIMNCYNGEKYLREAIDSIIAQSYTNWELIFWDNQSTDESAAIYKSYNDRRFKYFMAPERTILYEARNYAIEKSTGEFLTFLDVDDWWIPEKLALQMPLFNCDKAGVVYGNYWFFNEMKNQKKKVHRNGTLPSGNVLDQLLKQHTAGLLTLVIRKQALENSKHSFDSRYHIIGDFDMIVQLSVDWNFYCVQEPIAYYRWHGANETTRVKDLEISELEMWYAEMQQHKQISGSVNFKGFINTISYMKAMQNIAKGYYRKALGLFWTLPIGSKKIKLLSALIVPKSILKKIRA